MNKKSIHRPAESNNGVINIKTHSKKNELVKNAILYIKIVNEPEEKILEYVLEGIRNHKSKISIFTPNPEIIAYAQTKLNFREILNNATINLPDGIGIIWAGRMLKHSFQQRITGIDFMQQLCTIAAEKHLTIGLLGGKKGVAQKAVERLQELYPSIKIILIAEEWEEKFSKINIDILFIAFGFPKQEEFIASHLQASKIRCMMAVGGSFDYISGSIPRAPIFIRQIGMEWLFRLILQPWRLKRQLIGAKFFYLVLKERIGANYKS